MMVSNKEQRLASLFRRLEADSEVLVPDRETASIYATIRFELKQLGRPIPESDIWIAALARQHELEIVSNDAHFDLVEGVRRIGW
jgi:tRNA(fMet)-specific endonuclease VapC